MSKGYLANGLFSMGDRYVNAVISIKLRQEMEVDLYVPQENAEINDKNSYANSLIIAQGDLEHLTSSDFLIAVIDGVEIDAGVSAEIGVAYALGIPIFALFTDIRQQGRDNILKLNALVGDAVENQFPYRNLFVIGLIKESGGAIYDSIDDLVNGVKARMEG